MQIKTQTKDFSEMLELAKLVGEDFTFVGYEYKPRPVRWWHAFFWYSPGFDLIYTFLLKDCNEKKEEQRVSGCSCHSETSRGCNMPKMS